MISEHSARQLIQALDNMMEAGVIQTETIKTMQQIAEAQGQQLAELQERVDLLRALVIGGQSWEER